MPIMYISPTSGNKLFPAAAIWSGNVAFAVEGVFISVLFLISAPLILIVDLSAVHYLLMRFAL